MLPLLTADSALALGTGFCAFVHACTFAFQTDGNAFFYCLGLFFYIYNM